MEVLILRLEGPMISFGAPIVDNRGVIQEHPPLSMLTGLIGNALGYRHDEFERLQTLQERIRFAARCDQPGEQFTDFQTVDLDQEFMKRAGWTTRGEREDRRGGSASEATHIRYRQYLADARYTVALSLQPARGFLLDLDTVADALERPARPLFIGRKSCLPAAPLVAGRTETEDVLRALKEWPADDLPPGEEATREAWWPVDLGETDRETRELTVSDQRDWANQVHTGQRTLRHGLISIQGAEADE